MDRRQSSRDRIYGTPVFCGQESKTDFPRSEGNIGMRYTRLEVDDGRSKRVIRWYLNMELPQATFSFVSVTASGISLVCVCLFTLVRRPTNTLQNRFPMENILVIDRSQMKQGFIRIARVVLYFFQQASRRGT